MKERNADICLIVPTYGAFDYAKRCVESFIKYTNTSYAIHVIDDGSTDWPGLSYWPKGTFCTKFGSQNGLTRSWNQGLKQALNHNHIYTICGNSDLIFTPNWHDPLIRSLQHLDLVGPLTNAPGHNPKQNINNFGLGISTDNEEDINLVASKCALLPGNIHYSHINGFCMMAKTSTWFDGAYAKGFVFNPEKRLTGNEDELQIRWRKMGKKTGFMPQSFIFHYRSVSRPDALASPASKGAIRHNIGVIR